MTTSRVRRPGRGRPTSPIASLVFLILTSAAVSGWSATPARAHSFLATTDPQQGERLRQAPEEVALQFSERVVEERVVIDVHTAGGDVLEQPVPQLESDGHVARLALSDVTAGVYVVSWQVTSAVDGHESAGEFAFAVGVVSGDEVPVAAADINVNGSAVAATWLFFAGLAAAAGGVVGARALHHDAVRRRGWLRTGSLIALAGIVWNVRLAAGGAVPGRERLALLVATVAVLVMMMAAATRSPVPAAVLLTMAASAWSARSHSAAAHGLLGWSLDVVHIVAAAVWAGALAYIVVALWRQKHDPGALLPGIARYARLAAALVAVIGATGTVQALLLLGTPSELWTTGYGRILTAKSLLFAAALLAAALARTAALPQQRVRLLQRLTASELTGLGAVLAAAALLVHAAPPQREASASLLGPPPIAGDVVHDMGMAGALTVDVRAGDGRLDVEILTPSGGVEDAQVTVVAQLPNGTNVEMHPRPCGAGCYTQELALPTGTTEVAVTASAPDWTGGTMTATLHWPPPQSQPARFEQMVTAMRQVPILDLTEHVSSGAGTGGATTARLSGEQFVAAMPWASGGVTDVRPVPDEASAFSFYLPGSSMYFVAWVDGRGRLTRQRMVNPGHEIDYELAYPDR